MAKYIDADRLKAEIERRIEETKSMKPSFDQFWAGQISAFKGAIKIAETLQQEQQKPNLENEIKDYTETLYHETFGNGQGTLDEFDWEDIVQVIDETARYFYNLNKSDV